jgi:DNA-binding response OmpR family regulator
MRILVAQHDPSLGEFLQRSFEAENYIVDLAADGEETKAKAESREYGAAILDLNVSHSDETEVLRHIRARSPHLPILILTSYTCSEISRRK